MINSMIPDNVDNDMAINERLLKQLDNIKFKTLDIYQTIKVPVCDH